MVQTRFLRNELVESYDRNLEAGEMIARALARLWQNLSSYQARSQAVVVK